MHLYSIGKIINYELIIEEQLQFQGTSISKVIEKYSRRKNSLKLKVISQKLFNAVIFAILPFFPLLAYFNIEEYFTANPVPLEFTFLIKSIIFEIYFVLQITDFLLMGIFNSINIMSGEIFNWFKTLPLSEKRLRSLVMITIFQNYDITLLVMIFTFPIIMLIGTQNLLLFLICLGLSSLNTLFSLFVLVLLGKSLVKFMNRHGFKPRSSILFQFFNVFSYTILIFGSILIIQLTLNSISGILSSFLDYRYSPLLNLILTLIPFPFNPCYIITFFTQTQEVSTLLLNNTLIGFALFFLLLYSFFNKSLKAIDKIISLKYRPILYLLDPRKDQIHINVSRPVIAYIKKDLILASRNLQTFMAVVMPVVFSFVFIFYYNTTFTGGDTLLKADMYVNCLVILAFNLIVSCMLVYNLLNIEIAGRTILVTLPIIPRERAKAKLFLMMIIQSICVILPAFIYIFNPKFIQLLISFILLLPFTFLFLMLIFLLRIKLFGKDKNRYVIDEVQPLNKGSKWVLIIIIGYLIYFFLSTVTSPLYFSHNYKELIIFLIFAIIVLIISYTLIFNKFFPKSY